MAYSLFILFVLGQADHAHAFNVFKYLGDRTGLGRAICEVDGECERRRTEKSREQARTAEDELDRSRDQLAEKNEELTEAARNLEKVREELRQARAEITAKITNISSLLGRISDLNLAAQQNLDELIGENVAFVEQSKQLEQAFHDLDARAPAIIAGLSRDGQAQLKRALARVDHSKVSLPEGIRKAADVSARFILPAGHQDHRLLVASLKSARDTYRTFREHSLKERGEANQDTLMSIKDGVEDAVRAIDDAKFFRGQVE